MRFQGRVFKDQASVVSFAARQPGALAAFFLSMIHQRMSQGLLSKSKQLRDQSVAQWVTSHCGLTETRGQREALTLAPCMDSINARQLAVAMGRTRVPNEMERSPLSTRRLTQAH